ncbi:MAG: helix-turn-helix transcriptional regulator [Bacteroidota bacterium]
MKGYLGEFEELVLLTIATLGQEAYGVAIKEELEKRANRRISIGALHATISRLEDKGFLTSYMGGATAERGGRRKRFFELTREAVEALAAMKSLRDELWHSAQIKLGFSK